MAIVKTWLVACVATLLLASHAADVYPEKPETEPIVVASGDTAMTQGYKLFRNDLWACWRFDDADNLFKDSSGHGHDLVPVYFTGRDYGTMSRLTGDGDKVRGDGAVGPARCSYLSVGTVPDCLKGDAPFTISMWVRETDQVQLSNGNPVGGYIYVGNSEISHSSGFVTNSIMMQKGSATQFYCGISATSDPTYRRSMNLNTGTEMPEGNSNKWIHVAIVYDPKSGSKYYAADRTQTLTYSLNSEFVDSIWFGNAHYNANSRYLYYTSGSGEVQTAIDEIFVFTNALTEAEVAFVREHSDPTEFSAKWQVNKGGTLEVAVVEPQEVNGYGALVAPEGITLAPESESYFGGTIESAYLALDAASSAVTQTLAGAASYAGGTTVETGTLVVRPEPTVPAALQNGLVGFWTFDDPAYKGRDLSGCGNHMSVNANLGYATAPNVGGGKAIDFNQSGSENRWLAKTQSPPFDSNEETPAHTNGWPLTMAVWAQTRVPFNEDNKVGIAAFESRCAFGMGYPGNKAYARRLSFGGRNSVGTGNWDADIDDEIGTALVTNAVHCYVLTFDPVESKIVFFFDGVKKREVDFKYNLYNGQPQWPGSGNFQIGAGYQSGAGKAYYNGLVDQAMLWNRPLSAEEVASLYAFGQHSAPAESTGTIPSATVLDVAPGATAVFENANETVSGVVGAGSLVVSSSAKRSVTGSFSSTGVFSGGGSIYLGPTLEFASPSTGSGEKEFATAPYGMLQMPSSTECWTITGTGVKQPVYSFRLRNNGNGTETLTCRVAPCGLFMVFR